MGSPGQLDVRADSDGVVWLSGELDMANADPFFERAMSNLDGQPAALLDLSALTFLDSSGIRAILRLAAARSDGVVLRSPRPNVRKILDIAGIDENVGVRIDPSA